MRPEREARIAAEAAERVRDKNQRKDALTEAKLDLGKSLRTAVAPGADRRFRLDPSAVTPDRQREIDARGNRPGEPQVGDQWVLGDKRQAITAVTATHVTLADGNSVPRNSLRWRRADGTLAGEPRDGELTQQERSALMNGAIRGALDRTAEDRHDEKEFEATK